MNRASGAARIFFYNWPIYVATWGTAVATGSLSLWAPPPFGLPLMAAAGIAVGWSAVSLAVSYYVYDRSELVSGSWLAPLLPSRVDAWAAVDAGLDAELDVSTVLSGRCVARVDIYDPSCMDAASVRRARKRTPRTVPAIRSGPTELPLPDESCDVIVVAFTAHEIRVRPIRERFFAEMSRALRQKGRVVLVEHDRDLANFLAFGPGFLHFQARTEWLRLAQGAHLRVAGEVRVTPWIVALALEKGV